MSASDEPSAGSDRRGRGTDADLDPRDSQPVSEQVHVSERLLPPQSSDASNPSGAIGLGLAIGLAAGTLFGLVMGQLAVGIGIGIGMGVAMGTAFTMAVSPE